MRASTLLVASTSLFSLSMALATRQTTVTCTPTYAEGASTGSDTCGTSAYIGVDAVPLNTGGTDAPPQVASVADCAALCEGEYATVCHSFSVGEPTAQGTLACDLWYDTTAELELVDTCGGPFFYDSGCFTCS